MLSTLLRPVERLVAQKLATGLQSIFENIDPDSCALRLLEGGYLAHTTPLRDSLWPCRMNSWMLICRVVAM